MVLLCLRWSTMSLPMRLGKFWRLYMVAIHEMVSSKWRVSISHSQSERPYWRTIFAQSQIFGSFTSGCRKTNGWWWFHHLYSKRFGSWILRWVSLLSENPHLPLLFTPLNIILIIDLDKAMDMYSTINNSLNNDKEALGVAVVLKVFQLAGGHPNQPLNHGGRFSNYDHASDTICITYFRCGGPNHKADGCMLCNWRGHWTVQRIYCLADGWHYGWYLVSWYCKVL